MRLLIGPAMAAALLATPAQGGVETALSEVILPGFDAFAESAATLAETANADCTAPALLGPLGAVFETWMRVGDLRIGPSEEGSLSIAFWPDTRGFTPKTLSQLVSDQDPVVNDPASVAELSIAARGIFALDMLIADPVFSDYADGSYTCDLVRAVANDLDRQATTLATEWHGDFANTLLSAGQEGNATYLSADEATRAIYTQIITSLTFTADTRLGRPLGEITRARPTRAEAWRSGRSLPNVLAVTTGVVEVAEALRGHDLPLSRDALARVMAAADKIEDPGFQNIDDPSARLLVEVLQYSVDNLRRAIEREVGAPLGITPGFNASDGD